MREQSGTSMCKASDRLIGKGSDLLAKAERHASEAVDHLKQYADENPPQSDVSSAEAWVVSANAKIASAHAEADKVLGKMSPSKGASSGRSFSTQIGDLAYATLYPTTVSLGPGSQRVGTDLYYTGYHNGRGSVVGEGSWILHGYTSFSNSKNTTSVWMRKA